MSQEKQLSNRIAWKEIVALVVSFICFAIGGWHTAKGLEHYDFFESAYGSFLIAGMIIVLLLTFYASAVKGSFGALLIYIVFATVTFACNINWFYPHDRSDALIRHELRTHDTAFMILKETIEKQFKDASIESFIIEIEGAKKQLQAQIRQRGFGPRAKEALQNIEKKFIEKKLEGINTRLELGSNETEWEKTASSYGDFIDNLLDSYLEKSQYNDKKDLMRMANGYQKEFSKKINEKLSSKERLYLPPDFIEDIVKAYNEMCKKSIAFSSSEAMSEVCKNDYSSVNKEIGTFSHTFNSISQNFSDGSTKMLLLFVFLIDYFIPLALYWLTKPKKPRRDGESWRIGDKKMPTAAK